MRISALSKCCARHRVLEYGVDFAGSRANSTACTSHREHITAGNKSMPCKAQPDFPPRYNRSCTGD